MAETSLFPRLLGEDYRKLPGALRAVHDNGGTLLLAGRADIERRAGFLAWAICALTGLPERGRNVVVTVEFIRQGLSEVWRRRFGGRHYRSTMAQGDAPGDLVERFGPFTLVFMMRAEADRLVLDLRSCALFGMPLPGFLSPRCLAEEREENGRFVFDIPLDLPFLGRILRYRGWLTIVA